MGIKEGNACSIGDPTAAASRRTSAAKPSKNGCHYPLATALKNSLRLMPSDSLRFMRASLVTRVDQERRDKWRCRCPRVSAESDVSLQEGAPLRCVALENIAGVISHRGRWGNPSRCLFTNTLSAAVVKQIRF